MQVEMGKNQNTKIRDCKVHARRITRTLLYQDVYVSISKLRRNCHLLSCRASE